jgi:hypothetical protein
MSTNPNVAGFPEVKSGVQFTEFIERQYTNGAKHIYGVDERNKRHHISWASVANAYGYEVEQVPSEPEFSAAPAVEVEAEVPAVEAEAVEAPVAAAVEVNSPTEAPAKTGRIASLSDRFSGWRQARRESARLRGRAGLVVGSAALALAAVVFAGGSHNSESVASAAPTEQSSSSTSSSTTAKPKATTSTTEAPTTSTTSPEQLQSQYGNVFSGDLQQHLMANIAFDANDPEGSRDNFLNDVAHNQYSGAFWDTCLSTGTPSYNACVADPNALARANDERVTFENGDLNHKATVVQDVIDQFKNAKFNGFKVHSGEYRTIGVDENGNFFAMTNNRTNDLWLEFVFTGTDGNDYIVHIRSCGQLVEELNAPAPVPHVPETVPPTTETTVPPTTSTTVPPTTSTTVPSTTTSTVPSTTTTLPSTTTTVPTSTTVTVPKSTSTIPGEQPGNNTVPPETTPINPTTSTVPQESTSSTVVGNNPSTTAPGQQEDNPPINTDSLAGGNELGRDFNPITFMLASGGLATVYYSRKKSATKL